VFLSANLQSILIVREKLRGSEWERKIERKESKGERDGVMEKSSTRMKEIEREGMGEWEKWDRERERVVESRRGGREGERVRERGWERESRRG
jgi:hypothetical protein